MRAVEQYGVDSVVHFAAYKSPAESMVAPWRYFGNNAAHSTALMEALHDCGVDHVVFSSTCAVYGTADHVPVGEDAPLRPESPYGESKAMTEKVLEWYGRCLDLRSVSLRYFNAAGAWPDGSIGEDWTITINLIPALMKSALGRREALQVFGTDYPTPDGTAVRDYVHVVDLAEAHLDALEYLERGGETTVVNLGTGLGSSVFEVLAAAERVIGRPVPHELAPRRPGDPVALYSDTGAVTGRPRLVVPLRPGRHFGVGLGLALDPPGRLRELKRTSDSTAGRGRRRREDWGRRRATRADPPRARWRWTWWGRRDRG